jgi:5-methyltetrahydropteroyltriglutamate--homocysteine methyltransferase
MMANVFRADHVGSLLRPPEVLEARKAYDAGQISWQQLCQVADKAALKALALQRQAGLDVFTDGEYRRSWWAGGWSDAIGGKEPTDEPMSFNLPGMRPMGRGMNFWKGRGAELAAETLAEVVHNEVATQKLYMKRRFSGDEAAFLKKNARGPWKITLAGVASRAVGWWRPGISDKFYPTPNDLMLELAGFMRDEVHTLIDEGCAYVQMDSLRYTAWMDDERLQQMVDAGVDWQAELDNQIALDNASIEGARGKGAAVIGHHICRGNNRSAWASTGGYENVAEKLFTRMNVDRFLLEYDTERAGGFEPLRFVPRDKMVVLGLISSKEPKLETVDELRRRIDEAAKYVPIENLAISPQCGFASTAPGNLLTWDEQRRKLELVAEVARKVWG